MFRQAALTIPKFAVISLVCIASPIAAQTVIFEQELRPLPIGSTPYLHTTRTEFNWQPYAPNNVQPPVHLGQPVNPPTGLTQPWAVSPQPMTLPGVQEILPSSSGEIIISEDPVDGIIIGHYENGQLIYDPSFNGLPEPYEIPAIEIGNSDSAEAESAEESKIQVVSEDSSQSKASDAEELMERLSAELKESAARIATLEAQVEELKTSRDEMQQESHFQMKKLEAQLLGSQKDLQEAIADKSEFHEKMKLKLAASEKATNKLEVMLRRAEVSLEKAKQDAVKTHASGKKDAQMKVSKLENENASLRSKMDQAAELVVQLEKELKQIQRAHLAKIKKLEASLGKNSGEQKDLRQKLALTEKKLAEQSELNRELKAQFIKAFEAAKESKATIAKLKEEKSESQTKPHANKSSDAKHAKSSPKPDAEKKESKEQSSKEKRIASKIAQLRKEMKKKMEEARKRINTVGQKKIKALIKEGEKKDGKEVKAIEEKVANSIKISDRKIRARYERKILKVK